MLKLNEMTSEHPFFLCLYRDAPVVMINLLPLVTDTQVFFIFIYLFIIFLTVQLILHGPQNVYDVCQLHMKSLGE